MGRLGVYAQAIVIGPPQAGGLDLPNTDDQSGWCPLCIKPRKTPPALRAGIDA